MAAGGAEDGRFIDWSQPYDLTAEDDDEDLANPTDQEYRDLFSEPSDVWTPAKQADKDEEARQLISQQ